MGCQKPIYEVGAAETQRVGWSFNLRRAGFSGHHAIGVVRLVEFWCQSNAHGAWRVVQRSPAEMEVSFSADEDAVFFRLGDIFDRFGSVAELKSDFQ